MLDIITENHRLNVRAKVFCTWAFVDCCSTLFGQDKYLSLARSVEDKA